MITGYFFRGVEYSAVGEAHSGHKHIYQLLLIYGGKLKLQLEALLDFDEEGQKAARTVLEGLILRHNDKKVVSVTTS
ncbi:hypothetical protein [Zooshikella harenae]|uniref:Uncharacterized protein n=1 Tax=Zooshikella harenae TaxID=2827238 RepID=A0ABS5ZI09_9GAMM|nr:hypothetical protein [Zooshikella harenae]MBU2713708.1 hypothetical protein [Zooshikella harenae]